MARVNVIGAPFHSGGRREGVADGVGALRAAGLLPAIAEAGHHVEDRGDVRLPPPDPTRDPTSRVVHPAALSAMIRAVAHEARAAIDDGAFPLVIGGDCPILLGGLMGSDASGLLHVDGHEDAYPPTDSPTGDSADSEVGFALGLAPFSWDADLAASQPLVEPAGLAILGVRDRPDLDRHRVPSLRGRCFLRDDRELRADPAAMARDAVVWIDTSRGFWLHLDWDVLSNEEIRSVIFRRDGGITWEDLDTVVRTALADPRCRGWSAGTYDPDLDPDGADAARIVAFVSRALDDVPDRREIAP